VSTHKSETMRRMDAMKVAGLTPDMLVVVDTLTVKDGQPHLITSQRWTALYNSNPYVRAAYDAQEQGHEPTITHTPLIDRFTRDEATPNEGTSTFVQAAPKVHHKPHTFVDVTPIPVTPATPVDRAILVTAARRMAESLRNNEAPEYGHIAWLLDTLAGELEK
jgi:hypothetical protein